MDTYREATRRYDEGGALSGSYWESRQRFKHISPHKEIRAEMALIYRNIRKENPAQARLLFSWYKDIIKTFNVKIFNSRTLH